VGFCAYVKMEVMKDLVKKYSDTHLRISLCVRSDGGVPALGLDPEC
jgi:hypothetical protein